MSRMKGETVASSLQRCFEQFNGQRSLESFERFDVMDDIFKIAGQSALEWHSVRASVP